MLDDFHFFIAVWTVVSMSNLAIGYGCLKGGHFLRPHGKILRAIGWAFVVHGSFGMITVIAALFRHYAQGVNPIFSGIGYVAYIRIVIATMFWPGIAIALNYTVWKVTHLPPADRTTLIALHAAAFRLEQELHKTNA